MEKKFVTAILLAAGSGTRMSADITKQRITILGESVLHRSAACTRCAHAGARIFGQSASF